MNLPIFPLERFYKFAAPVSALLVFFALSLLYLYGDRGSYFALLEYWGIEPFRFRFVAVGRLPSSSHGGVRTSSASSVSSDTSRS